jgi:hypothetical protein
MRVSIVKGANGGGRTKTSMPRKRSAIVRWTGLGAVGHLESSVRHLVGETGATLLVWRSGRSIVIEGKEPIGVAAVLDQTPGVSWIAAGLASTSFKELLENSTTISKAYLKRGDRFSVEAEGSEGVVKSDVEGAVTSMILESVKGTRASLENPRVRFRAAFDGTKGVVGVEVARGPGGAPTGDEGVVCLVSGGMHSSVVSWMALLNGYKVTLVHAKLNHQSMLEAARLYSELSHRTDPRGLMLQVLEGKSAAGGLNIIARRSKLPVFGGFHAGAPAPRLLEGHVLAPLYVLTEEKFESEFESLSLKGHDDKMNWHAEVTGDVRVRRFGGATADISEVIDGLA